MAHAGDVGWQRLAITGAAAALMLRTRISPLWVLIASGTLGGSVPSDPPALGRAVTLESAK